MTDSQTAFDQAHSPYSESLGMQIVSATLEDVRLQMPVTHALTNRNGVLHGGAIMSLADHAAGTATYLRLPQGAATTTLESKTNFLRPIRIGDTARATAIPLHKGRTMMVWQTSITRGDGKLAAVVTQTQLVMVWEEGKG